MKTWLPQGGWEPANTSLWPGQGARDNQGSSQHAHLPAGCGENWLQLAPALRCAQCCARGGEAGVMHPDLNTMN